LSLRLETHFAGLHIHLRPLERQNFARRPPACDAGERRYALHMPRKSCFHALELFRFEKASANIAFLEERDVRLRGEFAALDGQGQHPFERDEIAIDGGVRGTLGLAVCDGDPRPCGGDHGYRILAKRRAQVLLDANLERPERAPPVHRVVV